MSDKNPKSHTRELKAIVKGEENFSQTFKNEETDERDNKKI
jgi:hypothetical protein